MERGGERKGGVSGEIDMIAHTTLAAGGSLSFGKQRHQPIIVIRAFLSSAAVEIPFNSHFTDSE